MTIFRIHFWRIFYTTCHLSSNLSLARCRSSSNIGNQEEYRCERLGNVHRGIRLSMMLETILEFQNPFVSFCDIKNKFSWLELGLLWMFSLHNVNFTRTDYDQIIFFHKVEVCRKNLTTIISNITLSRRPNVFSKHRESPYEIAFESIKKNKQEKCWHVTLKSCWKEEEMCEWKSFSAHNSSANIERITCLNERLLGALNQRQHFNLLSDLQPAFNYAVVVLKESKTRNKR